MSRISHKHKFIFFAFPKTGSESIRQILDPYSDIKAVHRSKITKDNPFYTHITPEETKQIFMKKGWNYDEYFKFVFVRNTYSRLFSLYNMKFKNSVRPKFSDWVLTLHPHSKERGNWFLNGQLAFIDFISEKDANGNITILVDEVMKLEEINNQLAKLLFKINIPQQAIPHINKGNYLNVENKKKSHLEKQSKKNILDNYNEKCLKFISTRYTWELKEYNYTLQK